MRFTDQQRKILCAIHFHADAPVRVIRRKTGYRDHTIHYHLVKLKNEGVIRPAAFINVFALGYRQYTVYLSFAGRGRVLRERLLKQCEQSPQIAWYGELGGSYHFGMTVCARSGKDFQEFLGGFAARTGAGVVRKSVAVLTAYSIFRKKYLDPSGKWSGHLTFGEVDELATIDGLDARILGALFASGKESIEAVAQQAGAPRTTVDLRLRKLEENGVIAGYIYLINTRLYGVLTYKLLVYVRGLETSQATKFFDYCAKEPHIVSVSACIGSWDYEVTVEVDTAGEMVELTQDLFGAFSSFIQDIEIMPVFHQSQSRTYMRPLP